MAITADERSAVNRIAAYAAAAASALEELQRITVLQQELEGQIRSYIRNIAGCSCALLDKDKSIPEWDLKTFVDGLVGKLSNASPKPPFPGTHGSIQGLWEAQQERARHAEQERLDRELEFSDILDLI